MYKSKKTITFLWFLFFIIVGAFLFSINRLTPLSGEDFMLQPWRENSVPVGFVEKVKATIHMMKFQAATWNARIGEMLSIVMSSFDKIVFDISNTLITILLIVVIFVYGFGRFPDWKRKQDLFGLFVIFALLITVFPFLGQIIFWKTGATNHTWGMLIVLSFGLPFRLIASGKLSPEIKWPWIIGLIFLGFTAGMCIENASITIFALAISFYFYRLITNNKLPSRLLLPILANFIGVLALLFSPSALIRRAYYASIVYENNLKGVDLILDRFIRISSDYLQLSWIIGVVLIVILLIFLIIKKKNSVIGSDKNLKKTLRTLLVIVFYSFLSNLILLVIPYQKDQARGFAFNYYILIALIAFISQYIFGLINKRKKRTAIITIMLIISLCVIANIFYTYVGYNKEVTNRNQEIKEQLSMGSKQLILRPLSVYSSRILETRETYLMNGYLNDYYQVNSIVFRNSSVELTGVNYVEEILLTIEEVKQETDFLTVRGWMWAEKKRNFGSSKFLVLVSVKDSSEFYFTTYAEYPRPDVARHFKIPYLSSGFTSKIDLTDIPSGEYKLGGIIKIDEILFGAISDRTVTIN